MLLAVDIGNTNVKLALFKRKKIVANFRLTTVQDSSFKYYKGLFKKLFAKQKVKVRDIEEIIICSVVPKLTPILSKALFTLFKRKPWILGRDFIAPIKNLYQRPEQVGQDRLANAVAAVSKYGGPTVVVDFGTALTFDLISAKAEYLGGLIVPGMELSLKALSENAALLPKITLKRPKTLVGRDTISSMKSGIVYGYSFLVEGILQGLSKRLKKKPFVVATGGAAPLVLPYCKSIHKIEQNLTLEGLNQSFQNAKERKRLKKGEKRAKSA